MNFKYLTNILFYINIFKIIFILFYFIIKYIKRIDIAIQLIFK